MTQSINSIDCQSLFYKLGELAKFGKDKYKGKILPYVDKKGNLIAVEKGWFNWLSSVFYYFHQADFDLLENEAEAIKREIEIVKRKETCPEQLQRVVEKIDKAILGLKYFSSHDHLGRYDKIINSILDSQNELIKKCQSLILAKEFNEKYLIPELKKKKKSLKEEIRHLKKENEDLILKCIEMQSKCEEFYSDAKKYLINYNENTTDKMRERLAEIEKKAKVQKKKYRTTILQMMGDMSRQYIILEAQIRMNLINQMREQGEIRIVQEEREMLEN